MAGSAPATWPPATRDGYYFIVDRAKDMIIRGGGNVYPREVEGAVRTPRLPEAAVGVPDATLGEEVGAAITLCRAPRPPPTRSASSCAIGSLHYKYPRIVWFIEEGLPKGPTGKILKREITPPA